MIAKTMMVSKGITLLYQAIKFKKDIREWRRQTTNNNTWENHNPFFHQAHREQRRSVTAAGKGDTPREYRIFMVYRFPLQKSITRQ